LPKLYLLFFVGHFVVLYFIVWAMTEIVLVFPCKVRLNPHWLIVYCWTIGY